MDRGSGLMEELISCLEDADCSPELISEVCALYESGEKDAAIRRLRCHRRILMDALHSSAQKVDCLDFLLNQMAKSQI